MAPSLVQSKSGTITTGTSLTITLGSSTTAGNCLIVYVAEEQATTNPTVSGITLGGAAGNFAAAKTAINNADVNTEIWVDWNCAGGQTLVVISFTAGSGSAQANLAWVEEWSGVQSSSNPVVASNCNSANGSSAAPSSGSTGTLTASGDLVVGAIGAEAAITGPGAPWTNQANISAGVAGNLIAGHQVVAGTTAQTYSGTISSTVWGAVIVSLLAAAASVQGKVTAQQSRGRQKAAPGQARTARAQPAVPVVSQSRARGRAYARRGQARTVTASPAPAVRTQARVRAVPNPARPGRVTVVRSTGAGVVIRTGVTPPPQVRDDKPQLKKLLLLLE